MAAGAVVARRCQLIAQNRCRILHLGTQCGLCLRVSVPSSRAAGNVHGLLRWLQQRRCALCIDCCCRAVLCVVSVMCKTRHTLAIEIPHNAHTSASQQASHQALLMQPPLTHKNFTHTSTNSTQRVLREMFCFQCR